MKGKISSIGRVVIALVMVLSLSLVVAAPVAALTQPTVTVSPATQHRVAQHTINFSVTTALVAGTGTITIEFTDYDATGDVPGSGDDETSGSGTYYADGDVTVNDALVLGTNIRTTATPNEVQITTPVDIPAGTSVEVVFKSSAAIKNPDANGAQTLQVKTSAEAYVKSASYLIAGLPGLPVSLYTSTGAFVNSYYKIQAAIDGVTPGATGWTIEVSSDYNSATGAEAFPILVDEANLTIESIDGAASTTIYDASGAIPRMINIGAANVTIDGFTIKGDGATASQGAIAVDFGGFTIKNNKFIDTIFHTIFVCGSADITSGTIDNNIFIGEGASAGSCRSGICLETVGAPNMSGITISNNTLSKFGTTASTSPDSTGINLGKVDGNLSDITITGNNVTDSYRGLCLWNTVTGMTGSKAIADNTFSGCRIGVCVTGDTANESEFTLVNNTITDNTLCGICESGSGELTGTQNIQYNDISGNGTWGIYNTYSTTNDPVASHNWWGDASGPSGGTGAYASTAVGSGDAVSKDVTYDPWLGASVSAAEFATSATSLNAASTVGVNVSGVNSQDIGVARYTANPQGTPEFTAIENGYFDVYVAGVNSATEVGVKFYDSAITSDSVAYVWDAFEETWKVCSDQHATSGMVWVKVRPLGTTATTPTIEDLNGTPFAIGGEAAAEDIVDYYRGADGVVSTSELLTGITDWAAGTIPSGFTQALTTSQLLTLITEWAS